MFILMSTPSGFRRIFLAITVLGVSALAAAAPVAIESSNAEAAGLTCAQGGTCVVGDTGPGGGIVFFVTPSSGGFSESLSIPDTSSMCVIARMCRDTNIQLTLTSSQVSALTFGYLEVAPFSAEATTSWAFTGCANNCGASLTAIGTGETNSLAMVAARPSDTATDNAAKYSLDLVSGGKDDWYLPSIDELDLLFIRHRADNSFAGLRSDYYHSSTNNCGCARMIRFGDYHSAYVTIDQSIRYFTRPIRSFGLAPAVAATSTTSTTSTTTTVAPTTTTTVAQGQASVATIPKSSRTTTTTIAQFGQNNPSTTSSTSTTSTTIPAPDAPTASPGDGVLVFDGTERTATVTRANNRVTVGAGGVSVTFNGVAQDGTIIPLDSDGNLRITDGNSVSVEGAGFAPNEDVEVWMFSSPQLLGTVKADSNGKVMEKITLSTMLQEGNHRFVVDGTSATGADVLVALGIIVGYESSGLSTAGKLLIALPVALAIIVGLVIPTTLRRRKKTARV